MRGWKVVIVLLTLIVACYAAFTWALGILLLAVSTVTDPDAFAGGAAFVWIGEVTAVWMWMLMGGVLIGMVFQGITHWSSVWTDKLPDMSDAPDAAALTGGALGAFIALTGARTVVGWTVGGAVVIILTLLAIRLWRREILEIRHRAAELARFDDLHENGTCVRADVDSIDFLNTWYGISPLLDVTASYDTPSGRRTSTARMTSSILGAPMPGGTVLLWFAGDGTDRENVDMEEDPDSPRDPDAAITYREPDV